MNRIATVLYPSGSDASPTPAVDSTRDASPARSSPFPLSINVPSSSKSIYDDPRAIRFPSPPPVLLHADSATPQASPGGTLLPLRRPSRHGSFTNNDSSRSSTSRSPAPTPIPDRSLRTNLMQQAQPKLSQKSRAGTPAPSATGRLTSMAKGPPSRFVVGGGQYLRVLQITDPEGSIPLAAQALPRKVSGRQPGPPFAKGPGGTTLSEIVNLWKGSWSIGKGVNAVDWATGNFENKILTATPSGSFMIFDVNRGKLDREVSGGHPRPLNAIKACKSTGQGHLILTGGTEGQARLWDLRDSEPVNRKYYKHNAPVTALEFCPDDHHQFVVGTEAGGLFRYDYRVPAKAIGKVWGAHGSKAVLDLKWKVGEDWDQVAQGWLASAGADRTVQIWDMAHTWEKGSAPAHTLHTVYPIRYVDWRPVHPTELLVVPFDQTSNPAYDPSRPEPSEPVMMDPGEAALEVWDVRRHYVSKFALSGCDDVPVAAIWDDEDSLVAIYQKGTFIQIDLQSRIVPKILTLETIPRQTVSWSGKGELAYAIDRFKMGEIPFDDVKPEFASHWQIGHAGTRGKTIADPGYEPAQTTGVLPLPDGDDAEFEYLANHYRFEGDTALHLCKWNREVAEMCGRIDEAQAWDLLAGLIDEFAPVAEGLFNECIFSQPFDPHAVAQPTSPTGLPDRNHGSPPFEVLGIPLRENEEGIIAEEPESEDSISTMSDLDEEDPGGNTPARKQRFRSFAPPPSEAIRPSALRNVSISMARGGSSGGVSGSRGPHKRLTIETPTKDDTPTPGADADYPDPYGIAAALESLTMTASTPGISTLEPIGRGRITSRSTPHSTRPSSPTRKAIGANGLRGSDPPSVQVMTSQRPSVTSQAQQANQRLRIQPGALTRPTQKSYSQEQWDEYRDQRCRTLLDWWAAFINDGEVQVASTLYVVGSTVIDFPRKQALRVLESYLELLERYRLTVPMAYVRRFSGIIEMQTVAAIEGITQIQHCAKCGRSTGSLEDAPGSRPFWWCRRCKQRSKTCAVCREPVRGLWLSCRKCKHGGHQRCMRLYYRVNSEKPAPATASIAPRPTSPMPSPNQRSTSANANANASHVSHSASQDSGLTERSVVIREDGSEATDATDSGIKRNVCPTGCGCQCRTVRDYGHDEDE